ncbi:hypothetical protein D9758_008969 [Tetrapyrgos nigripes]|uniref:IucC family-domain-containing protein n=1 Tax=Tetrapyrgos nigripes TaxID=182062 RepID=A0A8H5LQR9_9AGAR|nr:hypothetical protein D9758_008969 [Tetrapyrgos nigripes]
MAASLTPLNPAARLPPGPRAAFATSSRLISCLVTESLVRAIYFPLKSNDATGFAVLLSGSLSSRPPQPIDQPYSIKNEEEDILGIVPLRYVPVFKHDGSDPRGKEIGLLDPLDMVAVVFEIQQGEDGDTEVPLIKAILTNLSNRPGWDLSGLSSSSLSFVPSKSPLSIWNKFAKSFNVEEEMVKSIAEEFDSSVKWQQYSFEHPPKAATFDSPSIDWEQSIVEGHPTHPMHKTRIYLPPMTPLTPGSYDLYNPLLRFISLPRSSANVTYEFEELTRRIGEAASAADTNSNSNSTQGANGVTANGKEAKNLIDLIPKDHVLIPIHELQIPHIKQKFGKEAVVYGEEWTVGVKAQQSIRSIILPTSIYYPSPSPSSPPVSDSFNPNPSNPLWSTPPPFTPALSLKLALGLKLTSAIRTISPASAYLGPRFSKWVVPGLSFDRRILWVARERGSVVFGGDTDGGVVEKEKSLSQGTEQRGTGSAFEEIAKHCAAIVREAWEIGSEDREWVLPKEYNLGGTGELKGKGERLIVCTALVESGHEGVGDEPAVVRIFGLDTEEKRVEWLDRFVHLFFAAFLPPILTNGVAFEAHPQNVLARFALEEPHQLLGFVIRDFGGIRVHPETLFSSTSTGGPGGPSGGIDVFGQSPTRSNPSPVVIPGHSILAPDLEDVYARTYHTVIHNHLQQLIRVLGLHYNGKGWEVVRRRFGEVVGRESGLWGSWMGSEGEETKTFPGKCFMRMRMQGMYRFHLHGPFPNLIHYKGVQDEEIDY